MEHESNILNFEYVINLSLKYRSCRIYVYRCGHNYRQSSEKYCIIVSPECYDEKSTKIFLNTGWGFQEEFPWRLIIVLADGAAVSGVSNHCRFVINLCLSASKRKKNTYTKSVRCAHTTWKNSSKKKNLLADTLKVVRCALSLHIAMVLFKNLKTRQFRKVRLSRKPKSCYKTYMSKPNRLITRKFYDFFPANQMLKKILLCCNTRRMNRMERAYLLQISGRLCYPRRLNRKKGF